MGIDYATADLLAQSGRLDTAVGDLIIVAERQGQEACGFAMDIGRELSSSARAREILQDQLHGMVDVWSDGFRRLREVWMALLNLEAYARQHCPESQVLEEARRALAAKSIGNDLSPSPAPIQATRVSDVLKP